MSDELGFVFFEIGLSLCIVLHAADIEPVAVLAVTADLSAAFMHFQDKTRHVKVLALPDQGPSVCRQDVYAHTDFVIEDRLFAKSGESTFCIGIDDAKVNFDLAPVNRNRDVRLVLIVTAQHVGKAINSLALLLSLIRRITSLLAGRIRR